MFITVRWKENENLISPDGGAEVFSPIFSQKNKGLYFLDIDAEIAYKLLHLSIKRAKLVVRFSIA